MHNKKTIEKLKKNPYYMANDKELNEMEQIEYGEVPIHTSEIPMHNVKIKRRRRKKKNG